MKTGALELEGWRLYQLRYPAFFIALPMAAGIWLAWRIELGLGVALAAAAVGLFTVLLARKNRVREFSILFLLFLLGAARMAASLAPAGPRDIREITSASPQLASVRGHLTERATTHILQRNAREQLRTTTRVAVSEARLNGLWQPANGVVLVSSPYLAEEVFTAGRRVEVDGVLAEPTPALVPGLFNYREWLGTQGIHRELRVSGTNDWRITESNAKPPLTDRFFLWAKKTLARGIEREDEAQRLLWAMALGWKPGLDGTVAEPFLRTGTLHVFAISGAHIVIVAHLLQTALRHLRFGKRPAVYVVLPFVWFYVAATGWQSSAVRAAVMASVWLGGYLLKRPSNMINSLGAAAALIFLWDPAQLFQAGFQLSFLAVASLALLAEYLAAKGELLFKTDPFLPAELARRPCDRIKQLGRLLWAGTWREPVEGRNGLRWENRSLIYLSTSLAALLGTLPATAILFHTVSPVSLVANFVMVVLSEWTLGLCLASMALGSWAGPLTGWVNKAAWLLMKGMIRACDWFAAWPYGSLNIADQPWSLWALYYFLLAALLMGWFTRNSRRVWAWGGCGVLLAASLGAWIGQKPIPLRLTILPGRAGVVYAESSHPSREWLFDCADTVEFDHTIKPFLRSRGVNRLQHLALTQGDKRRMGAFEELDDLFHPRRISVSGGKFLSPAFRDTMERLETRRRPVQKLFAGETMDEWQALHPEKVVKSRRADDRSLVTVMEKEGWRVLLLGELGEAGQAALLGGGPNLRADILVMGSPDRGEPLNPALLNAIDPQLIIQTGRRQAFTKKLSTKFRRDLRATHRKVLFTDEDGGVELTVTRNAVGVRASTGEPWDLRKQNDPGR